MTQNNFAGAFPKNSTNLAEAFPKRCFKKDLNDVLQFCRENNMQSIMLKTGSLSFFRIKKESYKIHLRGFFFKSEPYKVIFL